MRREHVNHVIPSSENQSGRVSAIQDDKGHMSQFGAIFCLVHDLTSQFLPRPTKPESGTFSSRSAAAGMKCLRRTRASCSLRRNPPDPARRRGRGSPGAPRSARPRSGDAGPGQRPWKMNWMSPDLRWRPCSGSAASGGCGRRCGPGNLTFWLSFNSRLAESGWVAPGGD